MIHFITTAYGNNYLGLLLVTIESIITSNKNSLITVYWQDIEKNLERNKRMRKIDIKRGRDPREELDREKITEMLNTVVLNAQDTKGNYIEEILLDNWTDF